MKRRWRKHHLGEPTEVNITAFMNLMVVLVPFLLITAVFSRIAILDLDLPSPGDGAPPQTEEQDFQLEVIVRQHRIEVGDRKTGLLQAFDTAADGSHLRQVSALLQEIKARYPEKQEVTLLLEKDIAYERLVEMMDTLRVVQVDRDGHSVPAELFPSISIGDAPALEIASEGNAT